MWSEVSVLEGGDISAKTQRQCLVQQVPELTVRAGVLTVGACVGKVVIKSGMGF